VLRATSIYADVAGAIFLIVRLAFILYGHMDPIRLTRQLVDIDSTTGN